MARRWMQRRKGLLGPGGIRSRRVFGSAFSGLGGGEGKAEAGVADVSCRHRNHGLKGWQRLPLFILLLCFDCGGTQTHSASAKGTSGSSKEEQCLAAAAAHAEPKPDAPTRITVSHIVVRHAELAHPDGATRTRGQACLRALEALSKLKDGTPWAEVVKEYSDSPGPNAGSLGSVTKDDLDPSFAAAAFSLDVSEVSYVVESYRGFHIIMRNE
jgi:NIMA-interacting peptidyl-prolyl cis-trans isomerase 1